MSDTLTYVLHDGNEMYLIKDNGRKITAQRYAGELYGWVEDEKAKEKAIEIETEQYKLYMNEMESIYSGMNGY